MINERTEDAGGPPASTFLKYATRAIEVAVLVAFVFLIRQNFVLRSEVVALRPLARSAGISNSRNLLPADQFIPGMFVPCQPCGTVNWPAGVKLVVVANPDCDSCEEVARELTAALPSLPLPPVVISTGDTASTSAFARSHGFGRFTFLISKPKPLPVKFASNPQILLATNTAVLARCLSVAQCASAASSLGAANLR